MLFDHLLFKPNGEWALANSIARSVQKHFIAIRGLCFFFRLEKVDEKKSQIIWYKVFNDEDSLDDFYFDSERQRSSMVVAPNDDGTIQVFSTGFYLRQEYAVSSDEIIERLPAYTVDFNLEDDVMMSIEEIDRLYQQLKDCVRAAKKSAA